MSKVLTQSGNKVQELLNAIQYAYDSVSAGVIFSGSNITFSGTGISFTNIISGSIDGNAATATKATQDGSGNVITSTYVKKAGDTMTGTLTVPTVVGNLTGNADTATALTSNAGSSTSPIYFSSGKPTACGSSLGVSITGNAATATKANNLSAFGGNECAIGINSTHATLWVNYREHAGGSTSDGTQLTDYYFGNRRASTSGITLHANYIDAAPTSTYIKDYVTAQGTSNGWTYRTWSSGRKECWKRFTSSMSHYGSVNGWYAYYCSISFPYTFTSNPTVVYNASVGNNFAIPGPVLALSTTQTNLYALCNVSGTASVTFDIYVVGV